MKPEDITELENLRDWMEPGSARRAALDRAIAELDPKNHQLPLEQDKNGDWVKNSIWRDQAPANPVVLPGFKFDEAKFHDSLMRLVQQHNLYCEELTGYQIASALGKALKAGDFQRQICPGRGQQVLYIPGLELRRVQTQYNELLLAVGSRYEDETRHETALRYIRSVENRDSGPDQENGSRA